MTEEDSTTTSEGRPAEIDHTNNLNNPYAETSRSLTRLDEYQIRVVLALVTELLRD